MYLVNISPPATRTCHKLRSNTLVLTVKVWVRQLQMNTLYKVWNQRIIDPTEIETFAKELKLGKLLMGTKAGAQQKKTVGFSHMSFTKLCSNQGWFKDLITQIFETNQNVIIWLVKWFDLSSFESGCIGFDLKMLADLICDFFFHLKSERHF